VQLAPGKAPLGASRGRHDREGAVHFRTKRTTWRKHSAQVLIRFMSNPFCAHRFVRVLQKSCAAQDIGPTAAFLCCIIAHTEDAGRYAGPARFWNYQLAETMGFRSPQQLARERARAVAAGRLTYYREQNRAVGCYFVTIPERFSDLSDAPIEAPIRSETRTIIHSENGMNRPAFVPLSEQNCDGIVMDPGMLPIPFPIPSLSQSCDEPANGKPRKSRNEYPEAFEQFWLAYPTRDARRNGKAKSFTQWKKIPADERPAVQTAAENFSRSKLELDNRARDPERFLANDWWREWCNDSSAPAIAPPRNPATEKSSRTGQPAVPSDIRESFLIVAKHRHGQTGRIRLNWLPSETRFECPNTF
jgi:hypothetical protein